MKVIDRFALTLLAGENHPRLHKELACRWKGGDLVGNGTVSAPGNQRSGAEKCSLPAPESFGVETLAGLGVSTEHHARHTRGFAGRQAQVRKGEQRRVFKQRLRNASVFDIASPHHHPPQRHAKPWAKPCSCFASLNHD